MMKREAGSLALVPWMESLADPTRLRLLRLLERTELGVAELMDILQLPQSTVSRHLKLLAERGWITSRGQGAANLYALRAVELSPPLRRLWPLVREQTDDWATAKHDQLRLERRLSERQSGTQAFFARSAGRWDRMRHEMFGHAFGDSALRGLLPRAWTVADLACGTGAVAAAIAPHVARVIGVDQSATMLRTARRRLADARNVELHQGTLEAVPLDKACCDAALIILALGYLNVPAVGMREAARIVRPRGRIVVVDLLRHDRDDFRRRMGQQHSGFEPEEISDLFAAAGVLVDHCAPLPPEPGAKGPALLLACGSVSDYAHEADRQAPTANDTERRKTCTQP
jgi:ubiquinone/menaquinone biosynthesis C-methylase UbiE/DNA-binding transcriptional ArsR family regulator